MFVNIFPSVLNANLISSESEGQKVCCKVRGSWKQAAYFCLTIVMVILWLWCFGTANICRCVCADDATMSGMSPLHLLSSLLHVCTLKRRHSSPSPARATTLEMEIGLSSLYICVPHLFFIMQSRAELQECGVALNCCQLIKKRICCRCHACPLIFAKLQNN